VVLVGLAAVGTGAPDAFAKAAAEVTVSPLPSSNYSVRPACLPKPGAARCLALELVPLSAAARARSHPLGRSLSYPATASGQAKACPQDPVTEGCDGLRPEDFKAAYSLPTVTASATQTVAIVTAYDDPSAIKDLRRYDEAFGLPACNAHKKCLEEVNQNGESSPLPEDGRAPEEEEGWLLETSIDIEVTHAICQNCHILLVEADSEEMKDLEAAEEAAAKAGADEISNSWVAPEPATDSKAFDHPKIVVTAASGDEGYLNWVPGSLEAGLVGYPASSPHVVAVGGARLEETSGTWTASVWNGFGVGQEKGATGGGCSEHFEAPYWQRELPDWAGVGCLDRRAVADIAGFADPYPGMAVYDSNPLNGSPAGWVTVGGTSIAAPLIASMFALAGGAQEVEYPARTLYENAALKSSSVHDIEAGSNGPCLHKRVSEHGRAECTEAEESATCTHLAICLAGHGYDGPSGLGSPDGLGLFEATKKGAKQRQTVAFTSTAPADARIGGPAYVAAATSSSGLPVSLVSASPSVCEVSGSMVSFTGVGTCTVEALQAGDSDYQPAPPQAQSFLVEKGTQTVIFTSTAPGLALIGGTPYTASAATSSGLPATISSLTPSVCTVAGVTVSFLAAGTCKIEASQPGDGEYEAAVAVQQSIPVSKPARVIPLEPILKSLTGGSGEVGSFKATPSLTLVATPKLDHRSGRVTFSLSLTGPGTLSWRLTFLPRGAASSRALRGGCRRGEVRLGAECHRLPAVFAGGHRTATAGKLTFSIAPGALARAALGAVTGSGRGILVSAELTLQPPGGGRGGSRTASFADYLLAVKR
jgi:Subtilase family